MAGKTFLDINIIVYANDAADPGRLRRTIETVQRLMVNGTGALSTKVLMAYTAVALRKLGQPRDAVTRQTLVLERFEVVAIDGVMIRSGMEIAEQNSLSFWDGVIVAAALAARCTMLLSEDALCGNRIEGVEVQNPFVP